MKKIKILFVYTNFSSFVKADLEILQRHFDVKVFQFTASKLNILKLILEVFLSDVTFSWFAASHAFYAVHFSKIFGKKSIVVVGGYEVVNMPEINYGIMTNSKQGVKVKYILDNADKVLADSEFNKSEILSYTTPENVDLIYLCADYDEFKPRVNKDNNLVITVGNVKQSNLKRKGLITFVEAAIYLPNTKFVLIGKVFDDSFDHLRQITTKNVEFAGFVSDDKLLEYYQSAKVYVQVSAHEGFGVSNAEAMLCECIPVVTKRGALPEVVGDTGFYVPYGDSKATADGIKMALKSDKGEYARERVKTLFPIEKREKNLVAMINQLFEKSQN